MLIIFVEGPNSALADPVINGVTNCMQWAAYINSNGGAFYSQCSSNFQIAQKCCLTCARKYIFYFKNIFKIVSYEQSRLRR